MIWNKVEDKLPEDNQVVLIAYQNKVGVSVFKNHGFAALGLYVLCIDDALAKATHWMSFPAPPAIESLDAIQVIEGSVEPVVES